MERNIIKAIVLSALVALSGLFQRIAAQDTVSGIVRSASTGEVFTGASVTVCGGEASAMSGEDGRFGIAAQTWDVLEIKAPGCETQYVALRGRTDVEVYVVAESDAVPFYTEKSMSASAADVAGSMLPATTSVNENADMLLSGAVHSIRLSGIDAAASATFVRGMHSLNMTSCPLYIVDGLEWQNPEGVTSLHAGYLNNPLALIPPEDVESVEVLKNGTAIYGAKAANGVIVINTKRARNMATEIAFNASVGIKSPFKTVPVMNATDYRIYATEVMGGMENINSLKDTYAFIDDDASGYNYAASHNDTDWMKEINKTAFTQNYGISVRGGDEIALYYFSLDYARNGGCVDGTDFSRLSVRFNSDISFTKKLTARADIAFSQVSRNLFDDGLDALSSPVYMAYVKSPLYSPYQYDASGNLFDKISDTDELGTGNPLAVTNNADGEGKNYRFTASLRPRMKFSECFSLSAVAGISWDKIKENLFTPDFGLAEVNLYNDQGDRYGEGDNSVASLMTRNITLTLGLDAEWRVLTGKHDLSLKAGASYINNVYECDYGKGYNTGSDYLKSLDVTTSSLRTTDGYDCDWRNVSWHVLVGYNYLERYHLSGTLTMESSSRLGKKADTSFRLCGIGWGLFPSLDAAWIISNESFMKNAAWIDYLRLRTGYDMTGNDDIPIGAPSAYFASTGVVGLAKGIVLSNVGNEKLTWEKTGTFTAGLDLSILRNRLSLSAEFYHSSTTNLLIQKTLSEEFGLEAYWTNDGRLSNTGFDFTLRTRIIDNRRWKLSAGITAGHYTNKVKSLGGESFITTISGGNILTAENLPLGVFYGYKTLGVFSTEDESRAANLAFVTENGQKLYFGAGDVHFLDADANGVIDENDMTVIGNPNPNLYGNFNFNFQYGRLTLGAVFTYSLGNDAYDALRASLESGSSLYNQSTAMLSRWTAEGQITSVPKATYGDPMGNSRFSDRWIEDASYLRLKQINLTYTLPIKPKFIQGAQVWAAVDNVFTITKYLGADPEFGCGMSAVYQGVDAGLTPSSRSYNLGVRLNL